MRVFFDSKEFLKKWFCKFACYGMVVILSGMSKQVEKTKLKKTPIRKAGDASWVTKIEFQKHEETMSTMFGYVMDQFKMIDQKFEGVDQRFEAVDRRFEAIDRRFDSIDQQFRVMNQQFSLINQQFKEMRDERTTIYASLFKNEHDIARVQERMRVIEMKG